MSRLLKTGDSNYNKAITMQKIEYNLRYLELARIRASRCTTCLFAMRVSDVRMYACAHTYAQSLM